MPSGRYGARHIAQWSMVASCKAAICRHQADAMVIAVAVV